MIIESTAFASIPGLLSATLTESTDSSPSQLTLTWALGAQTPQDQEPLTIIHKGAILFHGKAVNTSFNNRAGDATITTTAADLRHALGKQTLADQLAGLSKNDLRQAAWHALSNWQNLTNSVQATASGWTCNPDGSPQEQDTLLTLDISGLATSGTTIPGSWRRNSPATCAQALQKMKEANPGTLFTVDYTTGKIKALKRSELPISNLNTLQHHITEISNITPNTDSIIPAIAVIVTYQMNWVISEGAQPTNTAPAGKAILVYPPDTPLDTLGIRVFTQDLQLYSYTVSPGLEDDCAQAAYQRAQELLDQLIPWFEEVNTPAVSGTVTTLIQDWQASPIATRLNLTGPGSTDTLLTPVTTCEWDFMALTVTLTLGNTTGEPKLTQFPNVAQEFHPRPDDPDNPGTGGGTDDPDQPGEDDPDDPPHTDPDNPTPTPGCNCNCECKAAELMAQIQTAIDNAIASIQVSAHLTQELGTTETGTLYIDADANATSTSGNSSLHAHY